MFLGLGYAKKKAFILIIKVWTILRVNDHVVDIVSMAAKMSFPINHPSKTSQLRITMNISKVSTLLGRGLVIL
jgi:hypothetical protein